MLFPTVVEPLERQYVLRYWRWLIGWDSEYPNAIRYLEIPVAVREELQRLGREQFVSRLDAVRKARRCKRGTNLIMFPKGGRHEAPTAAD